MRLRIATSSAGKLREFSDVLAPLGYELVGLAELGNPEVAETGATFADNALLKARAIAGRTGEAVLADDSGLEVDALGGAPGVHSARYAGVSGTGRDRANCDKLLRALANVPDNARQARFVCVLAYLAPGVAPELFRGEVEGYILRTPRGSGGFGYDPLFVPSGSTQTMAELPPAAKHALSHRGRALAAFVRYLHG